MVMILIFILSGFAVYRLTTLFVFDEGPFDIFENIRVQIDVKSENEGGLIFKQLNGIFSCPYCMGVWIALFVTIGLWVFFPNYFPNLFFGILTWLGLAGFQSILQDIK